MKTYYHLQPHYDQRQLVVHQPQTYDVDHQKASATYKSPCTNHPRYLQNNTQQQQTSSIKNNHVYNYGNNNAQCYRFTNGQFKTQSSSLQNRDNHGSQKFQQNLFGHPQQWHSSQYQQKVFPNQFTGNPVKGSYMPNNTGLLFFHRLK